MAGDVEGNLDRLEAMIGPRSNEGRLAVTSELAVVGYPRDLLDHLDPDTIPPASCPNLAFPVLIGTSCMGRRVDRSTEPFSFKMGLSSFGREASPADLRVFDERRYFEPVEGPLLEDGLGVTMQDLWVGDAMLCHLRRTRSQILRTLA